MNSQYSLNKKRVNSRYRMFWIILFTLSILNQIFSQSIESNLQGQLSGWSTLNPNQAAIWGLRYIPELSISHDLANGYMIDGEISLNLYGSMTYHNSSNIDNYSKGKLYRGWVRFSDDQYEIRAGLQKINFGPAKMLRPLMWFDSIDPRDPLQITDGVYGLLGRYFFLNNANIWLWGLYGNDKQRGWEVLLTDKNKLEYGGRIQYPVGAGEFGFSYHHRSLDLQKSGIPDILITGKGSSEERLAIDGRLDIEVGLWFEEVISRNKLDILDITIPGLIDFDQYKYQHMMNLGVDYTFDIGNGLYGAMEYFRMQLSGELLGTGEQNSMSAVTLNYPYNIFDSFSTIIYYHWNEKNLYRFFNWQRSYDNWSFYLMAFWNPNRFDIYQTSDGQSAFAGKGIQLMVVFNH